MRYLVSSMALMMSLSLVLPAVVAAAAPPVEPPATALQAFAVIVREVAGEGKGSATDDRRFEVLQDRVWEIVGEQATSFLSRQPQAKPGELVAAIAALNEATQTFGQDADSYALGVTVAPLGGNPPLAWVVAVNWYYGGTFFVASRGNDGHWRVAWWVRDLARTDARLCDELERWAYGSPGFHDGPFAGVVHPLPTASEGWPRFVVDASAQPVMGLVRPAQVSVWEWNGFQAVPIFFGWYQTAWGGDQAKIENGAILVRTMQDLKSTFVCGSCERSPEEIWRIDVTPEGVVDRGRVPLLPSLALVDEVMDCACHGLDVTPLATPEVNRILRQWADELDSGPELCLSMLLEWQQTETASGYHLVLETDQGKAIFDITVRGREPRITAVTINPPE